MTIFLHYKKLDDIFELAKSNTSRISLDVERKTKINQYRQMLLENAVPQLQIEHTKDGKPFAKDGAVEFNHSHSQNYYILAYSKTQVDIGVDIEDISRQVNMHALANRYFHPQEIEQWKLVNCDALFWLKIWTIKEAVLKAHGMGIRLQLRSLNTSAHPTWDFGCVSHPLLGLFMYQCYRLPHSVMTVAYRCESQNLLNLQHINWI